MARLELRGVDNVISVKGSDPSSSFNNGEEGSLGLPLSWETFTDSFDVKGEYNEWRVQNANPVAIFIFDPDLIVVRRMVDLAAVYPDIPAEELGDSTTSQSLAGFI